MIGTPAPASPSGVVAALGDDGRWSSSAARLLQDLGFVIAGRHLLVALRPAPTFRHFDPEVIRYYAPAGGKGASIEVDRRSVRTPHQRRVLWGHVHVVDRLGVENRFLTFGGDLRTDVVDADVTICDLRSPAPIVRWGGHSQGIDELVGEVGAFFGRLIVAVDFAPGVAARVDAEPAAVVYAFFLLDLERRLAAARNHGAPSGLEPWVSAERRRLAADEPTRVAAERLVADRILGA